MKKTFCSILISSAISVSGITAAVADTSGTLNFTGAVSSSTCTVDLNKTVSFAPVNGAEITDFQHGAEIERLDVDYNVSGCPSNVSNASLLVDYPHIGESRADLGNTSMRGAGIVFRKTTSLPSEYLLPGYTEDFVINNGSGTVKFTPRLVRLHSGIYGADRPVAGSFSSTADLTLSFN
ncbi:fimbrial protein [Pantoea sp. SS70]|uniref:fimbrial protein n=1 Tax=Pantoea sp. SS70 TaxID=3024247 RepID=UPI002452B487|nr:fimbrial protein [Pantoea sp. SS70]WGK60080.1 hypothetical protein PO881_23340 [Pantoea sp. SS70]